MLAERERGVRLVAQKLAGSADHQSGGGVVDGAEEFARAIGQGVFLIAISHFMKRAAHSSALAAAGLEQSPMATFMALALDLGGEEIGVVALDRASTLRSPAVGVGAWDAGTNRAVGPTPCRPLWRRESTV